MQTMIRNPQVEYVDEGDGIQFDLVISDDRRITFTVDSLIALVDKASELIGFDLPTKSVIAWAGKHAGLQAIIDGPEQIRDPFTLELCVERGEYLKLHLEHEALKADHADLKQLHQTMLDQAANKVTSLIATQTEVLDAIRAYCEVTDLDGEGTESYALRQYVANDADAEAKREMEER